MHLKHFPRPKHFSTPSAPASQILATRSASDLLAVLIVSTCSSCSSRPSQPCHQRLPQQVLPCALISNRRHCCNQSCTWSGSKCHHFRAIFLMLLNIEHVQLCQQMLQKWDVLPRLGYNSMSCRTGFHMQRLVFFVVIIIDVLENLIQECRPLGRYERRIPKALQNCVVLEQVETAI